MRALQGKVAADGHPPGRPQPSTSDHYDVIVIGAGGGTLTHALAPTGRRILPLERGDFMPREVENWDSKAVELPKACRRARPVSAVRRS